MARNKSEYTFKEESEQYFKEALNFLYNNKFNDNDLKLYYKFTNSSKKERENNPKEDFVNEIFEKFKDKHKVNYIVKGVGITSHDIKLKLNDFDKECIKILYDKFNEEANIKEKGNIVDNLSLQSYLKIGDSGYDRLKNSINKLHKDINNENEYQDMAEYTDILYYLLFIDKVVLGGQKKITVTADGKVQYLFNEDNIREVFNNKIANLIFGVENDLAWKELTFRFIKNIFTGEIDCCSFIRKGKVINFEKEIKNILLKGVPGTGKSWAIEQYIDGKFKQDNILRINIHSASSNADLMQGIGISLADVDNDKIKYTEKKGLVMDFIFKAICTPDEKFALILEEIQENSLNELIGDLIYLIEDEKRTSAKYIKAIMDEAGLKSEFRTAEQKRVDDNKDTLVELIEKVIQKNGVFGGQLYQSKIYYVQIPQLVEDKPKFKKIIIPDNLYIFCTTNYREDKKIIEDNLFRRFEVIDIFPNYSVIDNEHIKKFLDELNKSIVSEMSQLDEVHPDRYLIGQANWIKVKEPEDFYRAFLKLVNEFKEIREIEYDKFKDIIKTINFANTNKNDKSENTDINKGATEQDNSSTHETSDESMKSSIDDAIVIVKARQNYYELIQDLLDKSNYKILSNIDKKALVNEEHYE